MTGNTPRNAIERALLQFPSSVVAGLQELNAIVKGFLHYAIGVIDAARIDVAANVLQRFPFAAPDRWIT